MATYDAVSPYYLTGYSQFFLDVMVNRPIPKENDDQLFKSIGPISTDLIMLAFDLYDNANLWWVFYQRNPNTLTKPPLDFKTDTLIYLPKITTLRNVLGF
jgi:hypothetical protein